LVPGVADSSIAPKRDTLWPLAIATALVALGVGARVADGKRDQPSVPASRASAPVLAAPKPEPAAAARTAPSAAQTASVEATPIPSAASSATPESPGSFFVQVASFEVKETAEARANELARQGLSAHAEAYGGPVAGWWHVVRVGPFTSRVEAEKARLGLPPPDASAAFVLPRSNGGFHLQVASLKSAAKAENVAGKLRRHAHPARVTDVPDRGQEPWHCVRVGPFDSRDEAEGYRALFEAREGMRGQVIPFAPPAAKPSGGA
jgi:cell division septation protein DedD